MNVTVQNLVVVYPTEFIEIGQVFWSVLLTYMGMDMKQIGDFCFFSETQN
jgi:hypothetical protein